jgi:hypothetical protein
LSGCASRNSQRSTGSGLLELRPSPSRPTLCDCLVLCSYKRSVASGFSICTTTDH